MRDGVVTRKELLFVIEDFDHWTPQDRTGPALRDGGLPAVEPFVLDAELWPQERQDKRQALLRSFLDWSRDQGIQRLDDISQPSLVMVRVRCNRAQAGNVTITAIHGQGKILVTTGVEPHRQMAFWRSNGEGVDLKRWAIFG